MKLRTAIVFALTILSWGSTCRAGALNDGPVRSRVARQTSLHTHDGYYSSRLDYGDLHLPDLSSTTMKEVKLDDIFDEFTEIVDFNFKYYGMQYEQLLIAHEHGYIVPITSNDGVLCDGHCNGRRLSQGRKISVLLNDWDFEGYRFNSTSLRKRSLIIYTENSGDFVHIVWDVVPRLLDRTCDDSQTLVNCSTLHWSFTATLYRDGRITFNYVELPPRSLFPEYDGLHHHRTGFIGLIQSSILIDRTQLLAYKFYPTANANINYTSSYSGLSGPRSIRIIPSRLSSPTSVCYTASSESDCRSRNNGFLHCQWCKVPRNYPYYGKSFCANHADNGPYTAYKLDLKCLDMQAPWPSAHYTPSTSVSQLALPDLSTAFSKTTLRLGTNTLATDHTLGFAFPYFNLPSRRIHVHHTGFIYVHQGVTCNGSITSCNTATYMRANAIAPFLAPWSYSPSARIHLFESTNFAHVAWEGVHLEKSGYSTAKVTFSATMYVDGRIVFNYQNFNNFYSFATIRHFYPLNASVGLTGTFPGFSKSSHHPGHFYRKAEASNVLAYPGAVSATFSPKVRGTCTGAKTFTACKDVSHFCLWCTLPNGHTSLFNEYCTDKPRTDDLSSFLGYDTRCVHPRQPHLNNFPIIPNPGNNFPRLPTHDDMQHVEHSSSSGLAVGLGVGLSLAVLLCVVIGVLVKQKQSGSSLLPIPQMLRQRAGDNAGGDTAPVKFEKFEDES